MDDCEELAFPPCARRFAEHFFRKQVAEIAPPVINTNLWTCRKQEQGAIQVGE